jgi:S1-C subfamily serine protease/Flp pilus assembly protein TadD
MRATDRYSARTALLAFFLGGLASQAFSLTTEEIVARNEPACLVVFGIAKGQRTAQGSGVVVDGRGLILCTAHQVKDCEAAVAVLNDGSKLDLRIVELDGASDLALLDAGTKLPFAAFSPAPPNSGADLIAITAPEGLSFTTALGIVSNATRMRAGKPQIQTDLNLSPGSSGGPVFDREGRLVGIVAANLLQASGQTLLTPISSAFEMLARHGVAVPEKQMPSLLNIKKRRETDEIALSDVEPTASRKSKEQEKATRAFIAGLQSDAPGVKIECYKQATQADPEFFEAWFNLGVTHSGQHQFDEAIAAYEKAKSLRPTRVEVFRNLGRAWIKKGGLDFALDAFQSARELDPEAPQSYNDLGEVQRRLKRLDEAAANFDTALRLKPDYPEALYNAGLAYYELGNSDAAVDHFKRYLGVTPNASDAAKVKALIKELDGKRK